jgi:hypothetical protein
MIRVVPGTFCQATIIIIHTCNRKDERHLICGARSSSGGFADRSSERRDRRISFAVDKKRGPLLSSDWE